MPAGPLAQSIDWVDPEALFLAGPARARDVFWLDAGPAAASGWSWIGVGSPVPALPRDRVLDGASSAGGAAPVPGGFAGGWVGWLDYDGDGDGEAALRVTRVVAFDHARRQAWLIAPEDELPHADAELERWRAGIRAHAAAALADAPAGGVDSPPPRTVAARHTPTEYAALIERCRAAIRAGDAYQLCLTTRFELAASTTPVDPVDTYLRMRRSQPSPRGALIRIGDRALLSASPEQFLHVGDGVVRTRPIKGTRPRGADATTDAALARALAESPKERAENIMIVDLMRNDLQRVCVPGSVAAERLLEVESYPAVHQLVSTIAGRLMPGTTFGDLLQAAFPAGSMTGAPKLSAMGILRTLEGGPRGVYAGCFGWLGDDGRADLAMTIRSVVVHPGGAYVGAGGGITWLSAADDEVAEVAIKAHGPLAALGAALPGEWQQARNAAAAVR